MNTNYNIVSVYLPCYQEISFLVEADNRNAMIEESRLHQLMEVYWLWDSPNLNQHYFNGVDYQYYGNSQPNIPQNVACKKDYPSNENRNRNLLDGYRYSTRIEFDEDGNRHTIYCCRFENCSKEFTRTNNILDHLRMHAGIRPFKWGSCSRSFTQKWNLNKHMKTHLVPEMNMRKRYRCPHWDAWYTERYNYRVSALSKIISVNMNFFLLGTLINLLLTSNTSYEFIFESKNNLLSIDSWSSFIH